MSSARALLLLAAALCACATAAHTGSYNHDGINMSLYGRRNQTLEAHLAPTSCAAFDEPCLRCACAGGALTCARRACAPLPDTVRARGCRVLQHPGLCCPHLYCPNDVVIDTELDTKSDELEQSHAVNARSLEHACTEEGRTFLVGSALPGGAACEECFCVRGERRCVAPRCLPPPPHCAPRAAAGRCCPRSYDCAHPEPDATTVPTKPLADCTVEGRRVAEGSRVQSAAACTQCFCLRGAVRCGAVDCARPLPGCAPVVPSGHCCALRYNCTHPQYDAVKSVEDSSGLTNDFTHNALTAVIAEKDRSFRSVESSETTPPTTKDERTNKVKRKTEEAPLSSSTAAPTTQPTSTEKASEETSTAKPDLETATFPDKVEAAMKIMINGTINCTTSISSSPVAMNATAERREEAVNESKAKVGTVEALGDDDIITEGVPESFTVRVTSALHAAPPAPPAPAPPPAHNVSEDYDYDYVEPTLPPSLPNLNIIPFVAADAVVEKEHLSPKEPEYQTLQVMEREDKFPVYYPAAAPAPAPAQRRHDLAPPAPRPAPPASDLHKPAVNLFSPPMETEGGFVPKAPGLAGEYFAVYPPRPALPLPHLTTSMQLGTVQDDAISLTTPTTAATITTTTTTTTELPTTTTRNSEPSPAPAAASSENPDYLEVEAISNTSVSSTTEAERVTPTDKPVTLTTVSAPVTTTTITPNTSLAQEYNGSLEYEEEEEDEGFSFGSVLKLLLSESYDAPPRASPSPPSSSAPPPQRPTVATFVPLPPRPTPPRPTPPRKTASPQGTAVDRIDHLVLGEATAIRRPVMPTLASPLTTTPATRRPTPPSTRRPDPLTPTAPPPPPPPVTRRPPPPSTRRPEPTTTRRAEPTTTSWPALTNPPAAVPPTDSGGLGPGGLKLAGCNIYGRMYRVGRIIAELSGACQECRCTDTGVQCRALAC